MAATLTAQLTATVTYTTMSVTAMPQAIPSGETVFASQGLDNVEAFVLSSPVTLGDTTIHVVSQVAAKTHLIGENVTPKFLLTAVGRTMTPTVTPRTHKL